MASLTSQVTMRKRGGGKKISKVVQKRIAFFNLWPKNRQNDLKKKFALKRLNFCALTVPFNYRQF